MLAGIANRQPRLTRIDIVRRQPDVLQATGEAAEAMALVESARAREPHARPGWSPAADTPFVVIREGGQPVAGAALQPDRTTPGRWIASAVCVEPAASPAAVSDLVDALEAMALDRGATHLRFDATAFLVGERLALARRGYVTGPPYDGDADVHVWTERQLRA